jgi:hypothetical protein
MSFSASSNSSLQYLLIDDQDLAEDRDELDNCPLHHLTRKRKRNTYSPECARKIQIIYIIAAIVWIIIIFILCLWDVYLIGLIILAFPLIIFGINFAHATVITHEIEKEMFTGNFISFGFLIVVILINWSKIEDKSKYFVILFVALVLIMLSLVDVWVGTDNLSISKHLRSIFQTSAMALLVYALYIYYVDVIRIPPTPTI